MSIRRTVRFQVFVAVLGVIATSAGTARAGDVTPSGYGDSTLTIGQLAPQTGDLSSIVASLTAPVMMAVDEINASGGVLGKPVTYTQGDEGNSPDAARASLEAMLEGGRVDAIMGPASSGSTLGILDDVRRARVLDCSGSNTSSVLSTARSDGYYFRTAPPNRLQGRALAELVLKEGHEKVGVLTRADSYGVGLEEQLARTLTRGGARVVVDVRYDPDAISFDADVEKVTAKQPDAVVVLGFDSDGSDVVRTLVAKGFAPQRVPIYVTDEMRTNTFASQVDPNHPGVVAGIRGVSPAASPAGAQKEFGAKFRATGVEPIMSAYYYDCTILTALAAVKAKSDDPAQMKRVFAANTRGREKCSSFAACQDLLNDDKTIEYQGASAVFPRMNQFGAFEPRAGAYEIWSFDDAGRDVVSTTDPEIRIR
jgi:branched-chain amino acid transport system substrate-binding protein